MQCSIAQIIAKVYLTSNSLVHSSRLVGGLMPLMGCQSTIDRPDSFGRFISVTGERGETELCEQNCMSAQAAAIGKKPLKLTCQPRDPAENHCAECHACTTKKPVPNSLALQGCRGHALGGKGANN